MPDSDKVLAILIQLGVVGQQDVKTATDLLQENVAATIAGSKATEDLGAKTEDAAQSVKLFNVHSSEFNQLVNGLDRVAPGLGLALKAAFNPENIGLAAAVTAVSLFNDWLKEGERSAQEMADKLAQLNTDVWVAQVKAIGEVKKAIDDSNAALSKGFDKEAVKDYYGLQKALLDDRVEQEKKLWDVLEKTELAQAHGDKTQEEIIRNRYERLRQQSDASKGPGELSLLRGQSAQEDLERMEAQKALDTAKQNLKTRGPKLAADKAARDDDAKDATAAVSDANKRLASAKDLSDEWQDRLTTAIRDHGERSLDTLVAKNMSDLAQKGVDIAEERLHEAQIRLADDIKISQADEEASKALNDAVKNLTDSVNAHAQAHREAEAQIKAGTAALQIQELGAAQRNVIQTLANIQQTIDQFLGVAGNIGR